MINSFDRNTALANLDIEWARHICPGASSDFVLLTAMHKARYECTDIESSLRLASREWLIENGFTRVFGLPFLPDGELPNDI